MTEGVAVLGIRHHGPGSARSVIRALERLEPELVLVEGPPDAQALVPLVEAPNMTPPVALVVYPPDRPGVGVFYPFASFSPEWNAIRFALRRRIPVRFCDLPQAISLANPEAIAADEPDPIRLLAEAAGENDPERWWERLVEQRADDADVFKAVTEAIGSVRESFPSPPLREARREAHMRLAIRQGRREGFSRIAVVCGAWHAPALETLPPRNQDDAILRGLKRVKVDATWVPWTASRLAYSSGYGAGVESPAWYRYLWDIQDGNLTGWIASAARLLRTEDLDASPAQVVDAVRLAEALSALRDRPRPSLSEVTEATLSVLCGGESARMRLIERRLIVGEEMGTLPESVPSVPLQRDIETQARRLRLRTTDTERSLDLDLRVPHQLQQSRFLHRLRILGVDWGVPQPQPFGKLGTFHELWRLRWRPESVLQIVEACVYGNTLVEAATARALERAEAAPDLSRTTALVELALLADIGEAIPRLIALLGVRSAESTDVSHMLRALPQLTSTLRYGDVRQTDTRALAGVAGALAERATVGLVPACVGLDIEAAQLLAADIVAATQAFVVLAHQPDGSGVLDAWWTSLMQVVDRGDVAPLISGTATRLALNAERMSIEDAEARMARALSRGAEPADAAAWIEGFLSPKLGGSGLVLATSSRLFGLVDAWLTGLSADYFAQVLPLLRRTTSAFSRSERRQIAERVRTGASSVLLGVSDELDAERAALVEPVVLAILGIER